MKKITFLSLVAFVVISLVAMGQTDTRTLADEMKLFICQTIDLPVLTTEIDFHDKTIREFSFHDSKDLVLTEILTKIWTDNQWMNFSLQLIQYDEFLFMDEIIIQLWNENDWQNYFKMDYTFNVAAGVPLEVLGYMWNATTSEWDMLMRMTFTYDASYNLIEELDEVYYGGMWINSEKTFYTYDANNNCIEELTLEWDFGGNSWENMYLVNMEYQNNLLSVEVRYVWWDEWLSDSRTSFTYDGSGNNTYSLVESWNNGNWVNHQQFTSTFDANGREIQELIENWTNNTWVNHELESKTWNGDYLVEILIQEWESKGWVDVQMSYYNYGTVGIEIDNLENNKAISVHSVPNPFHEFTLITVDMPDGMECLLSIFDLTGKQVFKEQMRNSTSLLWKGVTSQGKKLETGIYLLKVDTRTASTVKKISIIR